MTTIIRAVRAVTLGAALCAPAIARAQSSHAEHADRPAAPAAAMPRLGDITFPTSSASQAEHAAFVTGVLFMHNFHYAPAATAFRQAQALDSLDVMAYWGEALSYTHPVWNQQDLVAARAVLARLGPSREARLAKARTPRERAWLDAVETLYGGAGSKAQRDTAYSAAMAALHAADPRDDEATTFYALSLLGLNQGEREAGAYAHAYAVAESVFVRRPRHPGAAHYVIHAVDDPEHAALGLAAARAYGGIAPTAGHAMHMTSHIFLAKGMWDDVVRANRQANATMAPRIIGHGAQWLVYGYLQQGRPNDASRLLDSLLAQARTGREAWKADSWQHFAITLPAFVLDARRWDDPRLAVVLDTTEMDFDVRATRDFGRGLAAQMRGDRAEVDAALDRMRQRRAREMPAASETFSTALPVGSVDGGRSVVRERTLRALSIAASGDTSRALALLDSAARQEALLPLAFGPPVTILPPDEAAGTLRLAARQYAAARTSFVRALARTPGRPSVLLGLARAERAMGHTAAAATRYREAASVWHLAELPNADVMEARARGRAH